MQNISILFDGNKETLNIIADGGNLVGYLAPPDHKRCPLVNAEITMGEMLGEGNQGSIFLISFPGMGKKQYVIKRGRLELEFRVLTKATWEALFKNADITWKYAKRFQTRSSSKEFDKALPTDKVGLVMPPSECKLTEEMVVDAIPILATDTVTAPVGSYLCPDPSFSEYVNSVYAGQLYRDGVCAHFFNVYSFFSCGSGGVNMQQYIMMDRLHGSLYENNQCLKLSNISDEIFGKKYSDGIKDSLYVQTIFAIAMYQQKYELSHNDLHVNNVFVECVTKDTVYNNQTLYDADWFHYVIDNQDIYVKASPGIVKIGDWGMAIKYSKPMVGDEEAFVSGYDGLMPNQFLPSYDSFLFTVQYIARMRYFHGDHNKLDSKDLTHLIEDCVYFMCEQLGTSRNVLPRLYDIGYVDPNTLRPVLKQLLSVKTAYETLLGPIVRHLGTKPTSGKIVTLGTL